MLAEDAGNGGGISGIVIDVLMLNDMSGELKAVAKNIADFNENIYRIIKELGDVWSGPSYDAFFNSAEANRSKIEELPGLINTYDEQVLSYSSAGAQLLGEISELIKFKFGGESGAVPLDGGSYKPKNTSAQNIFVTTPYLINTNTTKARDIKEQALSIQYDLSNDIELLATEEYNLNVAKKAIESMYPEGSAEYVAYMERLNSQLEAVQNCRAEYEKALDTLSPHLTDRIFGIGTDGAIIESCDWFWDNDVSMASLAAAEVNKVLMDLDPEYAVCSMSSLNGLPAIHSEEALKSFYNGPHVSEVLMEATYNSASSNGETMEMPGNPNVTLFNSQAVLMESMESEGYYGMNFTNTFSQLEAYEDGYGSVPTYEGYDSVVIQDGDDAIYMTYNQYVQSEYNPENNGNLE
jgi:uncharacterized protein YukE